MTSNTADQIQAWACFEKSGELKPWSYTPRSLGVDDVEIKITHCGICGTDIHRIDANLGPTPYPLVPGHEVVGHVISKGRNVTELKIGQRVGVGYQSLSCLSCEDCKEHNDAYCEHLVPTLAAKYPDGSPSYGGFATRIRVHNRFAFAIPDNLPSDGVAPLFCAGITVFSPMLKYGVGKGTRIGVIGIGGLGHLALQWGRALGAHTIAISHSPSKEKDALELGANEVIFTPEHIQKHRRSLSLIICTIDDPNLDTYLSLLKTDGRFVIVGLSAVPLSLSVFSILNRVSLSGSAIGSPDEIKHMLQLASEKNVVAKTQVFSIKDVNEAIKQFKQGKPHFRFVLQISDQ